MTKQRHLLLRMATIVMLGLALVFTSSPVSQASAAGATNTSMGRLYIYVEGDGVFAHQIRGRLGPAGVTRRCNVAFRIFGTGRDRRYWESDVRIAPCGYGNLYVEWNRAFEFAPNTNVCMKVGYSGQGWQTSYACVRVTP